MTPADPSPAHEQNRRVWDGMARKGEPLARPARDEDFADPLKTVDPLGWLGGDIRGKRVLCLAAGGGRQSALYAAAGGVVTVVDISGAMLELDRQAAQQRDLDVKTICGSMDDLSMLEAGGFDIVIHPVSTCYVADVVKVFRQVARVTCGGGLYVSQHKQPTSLQAGLSPSPRGYEVTEPYYREGPLAPAQRSRLREEGALEYLHRWEQLIGGMCRAGFVIEDLIEPLHAKVDASAGEFAHRCRYIPPYVRIKARRSGANGDADAAKKIWTP